MIQSTQEVVALIEQHYVPSEVERKRTILMYAFFGILITIVKKKVNSYEFFHLKQSSWWRVIFMVSLVGSMVFVFVQFLRVVPTIVFLIMMVVRGMFVYQAWNGKYALSWGMLLFPLFGAIGGWIFDIFELQLEVSDPIIEQSQDQQVQFSQPQPPVTLSQ